jgi:hypothetical protein
VLAGGHIKISVIAEQGGHSYGRDYRQIKTTRVINILMNKYYLFNSAQLKICKFLAYKMSQEVVLFSE